MILQYQDYNDSGEILCRSFQSLWDEIEAVLSAMPLHVKASDQRGIQGTLIFDPVGTNERIKCDLAAKGWLRNVTIPKANRPWGKDVDFCKAGILAEVQFSNYPFLLNNLLRSELFYQERHQFTTEPVKVLVIITKAQMFRASNSTLYYEQAKDQIDSLARHNIFDVPLRIVGLFEEQRVTTKAVLTQYAHRYSRTVVRRETIDIHILPSRTRCTLKKV